MSLSSNLRVTVEFHKPIVFAGEDVECTIIFRNVANTTTDPPPAITPRILHQRRFSTQSSTHSQSQVGKGARSIAVRSPVVNSIDTVSEESISGRRTRSLSIISLTSDPLQHDKITASLPSPSERSHNRTQSLQPRSNPSPILHNNSSRSRNSVGLDGQIAQRSSRSNSVRSESGSNAYKSHPSFKFPPDSADGDRSRKSPNILPSRQFGNSRLSGLPNRNYLKPSNNNGLEPSVIGTPRSSFELYSGSNHSEETLISEYPLQPVARQTVRNQTGRGASRLPNVEEQSGPETLMMGYVQVIGSFIIDPALVNPTPFEEVKRKGYMGGQGGGGVVEIKNSRESGFFGAFGLSNIGESIGGLLSGSELSSMKEMKSIASSRTIPILSTPQSILFVNMELKPGESQKYHFKLSLPQALPPSHKGRAIKVSYNLVLGIQKSGSGEQKIRSFEVPFRVFGTVDGRGRILSHDLLSPHIYLRDIAKVGILGTFPRKDDDPESSQASFIDYAKALLAQHSTDHGLISPTERVNPLSRKASIIGPTSSKEAIDFAIMRSNQVSTHKDFSTRFSISRSSRPVATIFLSRTAYRLGETISVAIDFATPVSDAETGNPSNMEPVTSIDAKTSVDAQVTSSNSTPTPIPVYAVLISLESHETIDPNLALRSPQSILRYTRRIHAQFSESAHFARRLAFALPIPPTATPEFATSGVGLEWKVRVEFVTPQVRIPKPKHPRPKSNSRARARAHGKTNPPGPAAAGDEAQPLTARGTEAEDDDDEDVQRNSRAETEAKMHRDNQHNSDTAASTTDNDDDNDNDDDDDDDDSSLGKEWIDLLEEITSDDRGVVLQGVESLPVETFELSVPVRVYGASLGGRSDSDVVDLPI